MTMRSAWSRTCKALTLAGAVLGAACGGIVDGTGETGYRNIDASGGEVRAKDTVVTVPEGAVDSAVTFTIAPAPADQLPEGAAGRAVDVGPENAEFLQPVTVQLAFDATALPDPTRPDLAWVGAVVDGEWEPLLDPAIDEAASTVRGTTLRSGRFGVVQGCGRGRRCPVTLAFDSAPQRVEAGACSGATVLKTLDAAGRRSPVQHDTAVALSSDEPSVSFYGDAQCQQQIASLTIPARQTDATFFFRGRAARSVTLTAQARDLQSASQDETISPGAVVTFRFATAAQRLSARACSPVVTVAFEDAYGNRAPVPNDTFVALSASSTVGTVTFFSDSACATATSGVTMAAGTASASFWFKDDFGPTAGGETITITAGAGAFTASQDEAVLNPAPAALKFYSLPQTVSVGACSGPTTVGLVDASGNRTVAAASTSVAFQTSAGMALYGDAACTIQVTASTIGAGSGSTTVYFKAFNVGTYTITASSAGLTSDSQAETVQNQQPGPPAALKFSSAPQTVTAGACSGPTRVGLVDASGNNTVAAASTSVAFQVPAGMSLYVDVACVAPVNSTTIPAGSSSTTVYFIAVNAGTNTITASSTGLTSASQDETVQSPQPGPPAALKFSSAPQTVTSGACSSPTRVGLVDASGNNTSAAADTAVAFQVPAGMMLYFDALCAAAPVIAMTIPAGSGSTTFYFRAVNTGTYTITASSSGLTSASQDETVR